MVEPIDLRKAQSSQAPEAQLIQPRRGFWHKMTGEPMKRKEKVIGAVLLIVFLFVFYVVLDANKYRATVHIISGEGRVGVNPTTEVLDFGDLSPGTASVRRVSIENRTWIPMYVLVFRIGGINDLMKLDKNYFVLPAGGDTKLEFSVYMPASAPENETLNGRVYLFKIPGPWRKN